MSKFFVEDNLSEYCLQKFCFDARLEVISNIPCVCEIVLPHCKKTDKKEIKVKAKL